MPKCMSKQEFRLIFRLYGLDLVQLLYDWLKKYVQKLKKMKMSKCSKLCIIDCYYRKNYFFLVDSSFTVFYFIHMHFSNTTQNTTQTVYTNYIIVLCYLRYNFYYANVLRSTVSRCQSW